MTMPEGIKRKCGTCKFQEDPHDHDMYTHEHPYCTCHIPLPEWAVDVLRLMAKKESIHCDDWENQNCPMWQVSNEAIAELRERQREEREKLEAQRKRRRNKKAKK